jgi:putative acyl-CoA dehydrogenase
MTTPFPNQPPPYADRNLYGDDAALMEAVRQQGATAFVETIAGWGATLGQEKVLAWGDAANRYAPAVHMLDPRGERVDAVTFHPAWHELMRLATTMGLHCLPWVDERPGAHVARGAMVMLQAQVESGTQCPLTMTFASVPVLRQAAPAIRDAWLPRVLSRDYDPRPLPIVDKRAALIGMGMTERQGGSDVRSNRTVAVNAGDGAVRLAGHKWFFSAPQSDAHLVLAQQTEGLSCFLLPHFLPDGSRNAVRINRLKDKLGNRSNASAEVEFDDALAWSLGTPGQGIPTIIEMVRHTRLDCVLGTAGMMRAAVARAIHHARHRHAFGARLVSAPLMRNVLADLALESEAAAQLALRLARAFDAPSGSADNALARVVTPAAKYWVCKRGPILAAEAMEVLGGNGYVEESMLPRLYREMPVNSIWEGSGNVMCLDVLRAVRRDPSTLEALDAELAMARGANRAFDAYADALVRNLAAAGDDAWAGRALAQGIATALQGALLLRHAPAVVADAFCATRLGESVFGGATFGTLPSGIDAGAIIDRALSG